VKKNRKKRKRAKIDDGSSSSRKRMSVLYDASMMTNNRRRRKQVKRCSGANLLVVRTSTLSSHAVKGKWNHACMQKEMMCMCI
jgi:hypothetical protein